MFKAPNSLKAKLGLGAGLISLVAILASVLTIYGTTRMSQKIETAIGAEQRIQRFSVLASQVGSFIVIVYEASQSGLGQEMQTSRLENLTQSIRRTFGHLRDDLELAVSNADESGLDEQSRRATRSIGIARMEAMFNSTVDSVLASPDGLSAGRAQGIINNFSIGFDPLLNGAITDERRERDAAIADISKMRKRLTALALTVAGLAIVLLAGFYFGVVRRQMSRLDVLREASEAIGRENFQVSLPATNSDEIGKLFITTNQMADMLARRKAEVDHDWKRLNQIIKEKTDALLDANSELAKIDENRRRFFADVSHELRTPLTVILMEAELALKGGATEKSYEIIQNRAKRLNRRIDDLLRIARSETGQLALVSEKVDLKNAVVGAADEMRDQVKVAGMELSHDVQKGAVVIGDANWIRQVISGLIGNSVRHAKAGEKIHLTVQAEDGSGIIRVIDNGSGLLQEERDRVLERFEQAGRGAKNEGFGIGLSLAQWVVEEQNGRIELTSPVPDPHRLGKAPGTMVTVCFPLDVA